MYYSFVLKLPSTAALFKGVAWFNPKDEDISNFNPDILGVYNDYPVILYNKYTPIPFNNININFMNIISTDYENPSKLYIIRPYYDDHKNNEIKWVSINSDLVMLVLNVLIKIIPCLYKKTEHHGSQILSATNTTPGMLPYEDTINSFRSKNPIVKNPIHLNKIKTDCVIVESYINTVESNLYLKSDKFFISLSKDNILKVSIPTI